MEEYEPFTCIRCGYTVQDIDEDYNYCPVCGKNQHEITEIVSKIELDNQVEQSVYNWLANRLEIEQWLVSETVRNQTATIFLLVWPILETKFFNNDMSHRQMKSVAYDVRNKIELDRYNHIAKHFHSRYQDRHKYNKLINDERYDWGQIKIILSKLYYNVTKEEKILLLIFVVYRYRNNIFHGIKSLAEWNDFSKEIQLCIEFMIALGEVLDNQ